MWFIRQGGSHVRELCAQCDERIQMLTLAEATIAANVELQAIYALIEAGQLHSVAKDDATLLVCLNSLMNFRMNGERAGER
jgi:DNA-binding TFAR19-related protein (PDSD5 family)